MSMTNGVAESVQFMKPGINKVIFKGAKKDTVEIQGLKQTVIDFEFESVELKSPFRHRMFPPKDGNRTVNNFNGNEIVQPSPMENFLMSCRQFIAALNPEINDKIESGEFKLTAPSFDAFADLIVSSVNSGIGKETEIKLMPKNQYTAITPYVSRINKNGTLYTSTKVIGDNLTLSAYELSQIENVQSAKPTNMSSVASEDVFSNVPNSSFDSNELPF